MKGFLKKFILLVVLLAFFMIGFYEKTAYAAETKGIPVLMYHNVLKAEENIAFKDRFFTIPLTNFEEQMAYLHKQGYYTATLKEVEQYVRGEIQLPKKTVCITFDDGLQSNYRYVFPILKKYDLNMALFLITGKIEKTDKPFNPNVLQYVTQQQIDEMKESKLVEFHGHTHQLHQRNKQVVSRLLTVKPEMLQRDLMRSRLMLRTNYFAYPFGQYDQRAMNTLKKTGYTMAFTTKEGFVRPGDPLLELKRRAVGPKHTLQDFKVILGEK